MQHRDTVPLKRRRLFHKLIVDEDGIPLFIKEVDHRVAGMLASPTVASRLDPVGGLDLSFRRQPFISYPEEAARTFVVSNSHRVPRLHIEVRLTFHNIDDALEAIPPSAGNVVSKALPQWRLPCRHLSLVNIIQRPKNEQFPRVGFLPVLLLCIIGQPDRDTQLRPVHPIKNFVDIILRFGAGERFVTRKSRVLLPDGVILVLIHAGIESMLVLLRLTHRLGDVTNGVEHSDPCAPPRGPCRDYILW